MIGEEAAWNWGLALIGFACGLIAGLGLAYVLLPGSRLARRALEERDSVQNELDEFRRTVDEHFQKTSDMFHDLTVRYRQVYEHLSEGAQSLVREPLTAPRLEVPDRPLLPADTQTEPPESPPGAREAGEAPGRTDDDEAPERR
jgi:hypothetical protein